MEDPAEQHRRSPPIRPIEVDAWLDHTLYRIGRGLLNAWAAYSVFVRRFHVSGWRRALTELCSDTLTYGTFGAVLALALALPAFNATKGDWRSPREYAVTFLDRNGNPIGRRGIFLDDAVPLREMPDYLKKAVLATEDRRFYSHFGIDVIGTFRALVENVRAQGVVQGGSSITQQLAKNLFLSNERTLDRKIKEAFLALWLEANLTKDEIFEMYLNRAYLGGGTFGVEAASRFYFGKSVRDLNLAESAMVAGLFKSPSRFAPHVNLPAARARANQVLTNMVEAGFAVEGQVIAARRYPATPVDRSTENRPDFFLDWAFDEVKRLNVSQHVLVVRTCFDPSLQRVAEQAVEAHLRQYGEQYGVHEAALVLMDIDGCVRVMVGGRDYGESQFNRATHALRQPGSSFKPYVYAAAMEAGFEPNTVISDAPISWGGWAPRNYGRSYAGRVSLADALARSYNTVPVRLARDHLGLEPIQKLVKAMGVETELNGHKTMVLGTSALTVLDQATGYSVFANGGYAGTRHAILELRTHSGEIIYLHREDAPAPQRVLSEKATAAMNSMLVRVPEVGTGRRAALPGIRSAGKTGTTQEYRDAWYVGYTGNYVAAVWLGNDDYHPTRNMTGGTLPAMVWQRLMAYAHQNIELKPIPGIENPLPQGSRAVADAAAPDAQNGSSQPAPNLSLASRSVLEKLSELFNSAPALALPDGPETLTAL